MRGLTATGSAALLALALTGAANAQNYHPDLPTTGTSEVDIDANIDFDADFYTIAARYGYFFNRSLQLGVEGSFLDGDEIDKSYTVGIFGNWHFPNRTRWLPYVGLFGGYAESDDEDDVSYGAQGGVKYFFNQNVAGFAELRWREADDADASTRAVIGLAVFFGPGRGIFTRQR
jgi:hypothetical protein